MMDQDFVGDDMLKDAWGSELKVECYGAKVCVRSAGANRRDEKRGGDDIQVCQRNQ